MATFNIKKRINLSDCMPLSIFHKRESLYMLPKGKFICMLKRKFCVASFWYLTIVILFVFVFFSFTAHILYILVQILGYFREHGPRLFTVLLYTLFYIIMHVIYISEYFFLLYHCLSLSSTRMFATLCQTPCGSQWNHKQVFSKRLK